MRKWHILDDMCGHPGMAVGEQVDAYLDKALALRVKAILEKRGHKIRLGCTEEK